MLWDKLRTKVVQMLWGSWLHDLPMLLPQLVEKAAYCVGVSQVA
jgi:hypothetical protein